MVKITYITRINFFSDKAHVHTITKTCEALSVFPGTNITLVSTDNSIESDSEKRKFFVSHGVLDMFPVVSLKSLSNVFKNSSNFFTFNTGTFFANLSLVRYVWSNRRDIDIVYFRDHLILPVILFSKYVLGKKVIYESHYILTKKFGQWLTEKSVAVSNGVIAIAQALRDYYKKYNNNIVISYCTSSDKEKYQTPLSTKDFREKVSLVENLFYIIYTGNIDKTGNGDSYGVEDVVESLPFMPPDVCFVAVGKKNNLKHQWEVLAESLGVSERFKCIEWVSRDKVVEYIMSADVLVIPKSGAKPGNSPTKMFEYLGTGKPIVAADTLPIKEVLHDGVNASLVDYSNPQAWASAVLYIKDRPEYKDKIVVQAMKDADLYTWKARAVTISSLIKNIHD